MATTTTTTETRSWKEHLEQRCATDGTWPKRMMEKSLDHLDNSGMDNFTTFVMEVSTAGGDAAALAAEGGGKVRFLHELTVSKVSEEGGGDSPFCVAGVMGLGHTTTLRVITQDTWEGTNVAASTGTRATTPRAPSIQEFIEAGTPAGWRAAKGRDNPPPAAADRYPLVTDIENIRGVILIHPTHWKLMPTRSIAAEDLGLALSKSLPLDEETVDRMPVSSISEDQKKLTQVLTWLWMVANGHLEGETVEPDESAELGEAYARIEAKRRPTSATMATPTTPAGTVGFSPATEAAMRDVLSTLSRQTEKSLELQVEASNRKKMTHRLVDEQAYLFTFLAAESWTEENPSQSDFTKKLLAGVPRDSHAGANLWKAPELQICQRNHTRLPGRPDSNPALP